MDVPLCCRQPLGNWEPLRIGFFHWKCVWTCLACRHMVWAMTNSGSRGDHVPRNLVGTQTCNLPSFSMRLWFLWAQIQEIWPMRSDCLHQWRLFLERSGWEPVTLLPWESLTSHRIWSVLEHLASSITGLLWSKYDLRIYMVLEFWISRAKQPKQPEPGLYTSASCWRAGRPQKAKAPCHVLLFLASWCCQVSHHGRMLLAFQESSGVEPPA